MRLEQALPCFKALADSTRLRLLYILLSRELNVNELVSILEMGQSRISRHLKILADSGLIRSRRDGLWVFYTAARTGPAEPILNSLQGLMDHDPTVQRDLALAEKVISEGGDAVRKFFDRIAHDWDSLNKDILGDFDIGREILRRTPKCLTAADLGCGSGLMMVHLATRAELVIGVDASFKMLDVARGRFSSNPNAVSLRVGNMDNLPIRDAEADFALISMVLHHLLHPENGVREAFRILKKGGVFLVVDFLSHANEMMRTRYGDRRLGLGQEELESWLSAAGFEISEISHFPVNQGLTVQLLTCLKQ